MDAAVADDSIEFCEIALALGLKVMRVPRCGPGIRAQSSKRSIQVVEDVTIRGLISNLDRRSVRVEV